MSRSIALALLLLLGSTAHAKPRYFVKLQAVKESGSCKLAEQAAKVIKTLLGQFAQVTMDLDGASPADKKALARELKRRGLQGYAIVFRITTCKHELTPPAKGKVYKTLMVEVATAIDAEKVPSGQMALAGTGSASVGTEVSVIKDKELASLRSEALATAAKQAVDRFVGNLGGAKKKPRRARRRRR